MRFSLFKKNNNHMPKTTTTKTVKPVKPAKQLVKKVATVAVKKAVKTEEVKESSAKLTLPVLSPTGEKIGTISLPAELFGTPYHAQLIAQALRIYRMNQMEGSAMTKTRGMVTGSTRKIYRQKGTGRARHGNIRAPIFVGGGIIFGPEPRTIHQTLPKQMKKVALNSALSSMVRKNNVMVVDGLAQLPIKTKAFAKMLDAIQATKRVLFVYGSDTAKTVRAVHNMKNVLAVSYQAMSTFDVMTRAHIVFTKDALVSFIASEKKA